MPSMFGVTTTHVARAVGVGAWLVAAVTTGGQIDDAVSNLPVAGRYLLGIGAWVLWATTMLALIVRHAVALTAARLGATGSVVAAVVAVSVASPTTAVAFGALVPPAITAAATMTRPIGEAWVDGASYGDERRFPLRVPLHVLLGPIQIAWIAVVGGIGLGPILLANGLWWVGTPLTAVGLAAAWLGARALHQLSRRWIVFVPAGVVVHDLMTTREPFLMIHGQVSSIGPADASLDLAAAEVLDATQNAPGLVISIELDKAVDLVLAPTKTRIAEAASRSTIAVVPSNPVHVVEAFLHRRNSGTQTSL